MKECLTEKFKEKSLRDRLLETGDAVLEESNNWGDKIWGTVNGQGQNMLGKLLMEIRAEIKKEIEERKNIK